jgi:hypothetical protein
MRPTCEVGPASEVGGPSEVATAATATAATVRPGLGRHYGRREPEKGDARHCEKTSRKCVHGFCLRRWYRLCDTARHDEFTTRN